MIPGFKNAFGRMGVDLEENQLRVRFKSGTWSVALDTTKGKVFKLVNVLPLGKEAEYRLANLNPLVTRYLRYHDISAAGMEEVERMTAPEFGRKYGERLLVPEGQKGQVESWLRRDDVQATVLDLPVQLPLYVKGDRLFWRIVDDLLPRVDADPQFREIHLTPILLPTSQWSDLGLILRDPLFDLSEADNPRGLRVRVVEPEEVPRLIFTDLLLDIFQSRLSVPESKRLAAFVFTDSEGRARLVLLHEA